ncbi:hypothetical protein, partial [Asanoa ishikariensis]|uniref:hypothetical protein n=1 Tax=Asanoa ishikariensis TaxID=137265 RepID=UPI001EF380F0
MVGAQRLGQPDADRRVAARVLDRLPEREVVRHCQAGAGHVEQAGWQAGQGKHISHCDALLGQRRREPNRRLAARGCHCSPSDGAAASLIGGLPRMNAILSPARRCGEPCLPADSGRTSLVTHRAA